MSFLSSVKGEIGTEDNPAESGFQLVQEQPNAPSGFYFIQSPQMPDPLEMYVDTEAEGGGYDYFPIQSGFGGDQITDPHSGDALGLDVVYPRSPEHWESMGKFVRDELGESGSDFDRYFRTCYGITRNTETVSGGDYTGFIMRDPDFYSSGAPDWGVPDGGRWYLRGSGYDEPNGDYLFDGWLDFRDGFDENNLTADITFNDSDNPPSIGSFFLVSTNAKT